MSRSTSDHVVDEGDVTHVSDESFPIAMPRGDKSVMSPLPSRGDYTPAQFAAVYEIEESRVRQWMAKGFVRSDRGIIRERDRLFMERTYGEPAHPRSVLP